ncbi:unnamed protein product [marine sediment metagenome]|uniref:GYD domain-containing protein n=1 Tax=marine sediment metagenome TaxID=412755 RepID=X0WTU3_9ZZZZ
MRQAISALAFLAALLSAMPDSTHAQAAEAGSGKLRTFLFIGEPNAAAWKFMIENPVDRQKAAGQAIEKLGGKMLSYYWGVGDGRNYITVAMPDDIELIQANYLTRLGDGLLISYKMIELMSSEAMTGALKRVRDVKAVDDIK